MDEPKYSTPFYAKFWHGLQRFPEGLALGAKEAPKVSGPAAAALISASFSCFILMINQHLAAMFSAWNTIIWNLGIWIPGSKTGDPYYGEIGSYSGQETILLVSWLVSWFFLNKLWRNKEIKTKTIFFCLFGFMVAATIMNWHPLFPHLPLMPQD